MAKINIIQAAQAVMPSRQLSSSGDPTSVIRSVIVVVGGIVLLLGLLGGYVRFRQNLANEYQNVAEATAYTAARFDHELDLRRQNIDNLVDAATELLSGRYGLNLQAAEHLRFSPGKDGYTLGAVPGFAPSELGLLTGEGPAPAPNSWAAREVAMVIGLTPLFRGMKHRERDLPWVYYTSAKHFIYVYPRPDGETGAHYAYPKDADHRAYYADALVGPNPERQAIWTPIYDDGSGKGKVVTLSKPVYQQDQLRGMMSLDVSVQTLLNGLHVKDVPYSTVHLIDANGRDMLQPQEPVLPVGLVLDPSGKPVRIGDAVYTAVPLKAANWFLVAKSDRQAIVWTAIKATSLLVGAIAVLALSIMLLGLLTHAMRRMRTMVIRDGLTQLFNRRHFDETARREFASCRRTGQQLGLAIIDIDFFKKYNDHYGHANGDKVLRRVAQVLQDTLRRATDGVYRVGGEEFAVLTYLDDPEQMPALMTSLCEAVRALAIEHVQSQWQQVTISVGATVVGATHPLELDAAYREADEALYLAKNGGRNCYQMAATVVGDGATAILVGR
ncbi:diguanylate cyclase [Neisseriaceae bacterium JH1-16]|nr:diguanylate cyclase [Neisseriaceae bacterium JH1-16]